MDIMGMTCRCYFLLGIFLIIILISGCKDTNNSVVSENNNNAIQIVDDTIKNEEQDQDSNQFMKGFNLPVDQRGREQAEKEIADIFMTLENQCRPYWNEENNEYEIPETVMEIMVSTLSKKGYVVKADGIYSNIGNEKVIEQFLENAQNKIEGEVVLYVIRRRGAITRYQYIYDGSDMYVLASGMTFKRNGDYTETYCSYTRLKSWRYTEDGWFCYELCVPEYPEVTEIVDGSVLIRIRPISEVCREASEKYVLGLRYQGNNVLCSNWNSDSLEQLDYTGIYEYLYAIDTGERFVFPEEAKGIDADAFETLIMKYFPVARETIRECTPYDDVNQVYYWDSLGCMNYAPTYFDTSFPEVTDMKTNEDGTITLTINAVCEMILNDEAFITHELTVKTNEDGSFVYLGNTILEDGIEKIPQYQYRITREQAK